MKQEIVNNIDRAIGYLNLIKEEISNDTADRIDTLDQLSFVQMILGLVSEDVNKHIKLKDAA
jgi:hypothetical protein